MDNLINGSRRNFLKKSGIGIGGSLIPCASIFSADPSREAGQKTTAEAMVVTIDIKDGDKDNSLEGRMKRVIRRMKEVAGLKPDIMCLPEQFTGLAKESDQSPDEAAGAPTETAAKLLTAFARENRCYVACPVIRRDGDLFYSSTQILDRTGKTAGVYDKVYPSLQEMSADNGLHITPGKKNQPSISTDFGKIGVQMGDDVYHSEGWEHLSKEGAALVLYPSSFPGGRMLNYHAVRNHYYIVSAAAGDARIIDISGNTLDNTSEFIRYSWMMLNMERTNILTFPNRLPELFSKYGGRLRLKAWGNTDMLTIESVDPKLRVKEVLREFNLMTYREQLESETKVQNEYRLKG